MALKVLRWPGQPEALARFRYEAELLGSVRQANIAQIYESGTAELGGTQFPYFAMELVEGKPITEHTDEACLELYERPNLLARVCDAVEYEDRAVRNRDKK